MAGGKRVAPPDRRLAQKGDGQQRERCAPLVAHEGHKRAHAYRHKEREHGETTGTHALRLLERQQHRHDAGDEQHEAHAVEGPRLLAGRPGDETQREQHGNDTQRHVDKKHAAPAEMMREIAADHGPERAGRHHHAGEIALVAGAFARRDRLADQSLRQRHQAAAAETLQDARESQHLDAGGRGAQQRSRKEDAERNEHHALAAVDVAQLTVDGSGDGAGDEIGDHHPRDALDSAERGGNRRERGGDDRLVHHRQEHRQHDGWEDAEE